MQYVPTLIILCVATAAHAEDVSHPDPGRRLSLSAPEFILGDRLFFETRFAQYFFANFNGDVNAPLVVGDPVVDQVPRPGRSSLEGPFRGRSMSCRHCHLGDDFLHSEPLAQRTYVDFTARSAIPQRTDGLTHTVRNSPLMVDFGLPREVPRLLHFDGEFANAEDLVSSPGRKKRLEQENLSRCTDSIDLPGSDTECQAAGDREEPSPFRSEKPLR